MRLTAGKSHIPSRREKGFFGGKGVANSKKSTGALMPKSSTVGGALLKVFEIYSFFSLLCK